jgi:hypothetical protein
MEKNKAEIQIIRRSHKTNFWYNDEFFTYEVITEGKEEASFIWKSGARIYGPLIQHSTEEGIEVYNAIQAEIAAKGSKI